MVEKSAKRDLNYSAVGAALGLSRQVVWAWFQTGRRIPAERVLDVERVTKIPRQHLRPDLYPAEARK
jgi:DNA-binding transcriptional regulator YdaS (Cro superfamily)